MFDKAKALNDLRKTQAEMKKQMEAIHILNEKRDMKVVIRGDKKIEEILIDGENQKDLVDLINDTLKKVDKKVEKQMRGQLSNLGIPGL